MHGVGRAVPQGQAVCAVLEVGREARRRVRDHTAGNEARGEDDAGDGLAHQCAGAAFSE